MIPVTFPQQNRIYKKPEGWTDEQCSDLAVWEGEAPIDDQGTTSHTIISCWQPNKEDIKAINEGKPIFMLISGHSQPPIAIQTENPFINEIQPT